MKNTDLGELILKAGRKGSEKQYLAWISLKPSCISRQYSEYHESGIHRSIACHVRRVKFGSGTGIKPAYMAVPMTAKEHAVQHGMRGERGVLADAGFDVSEEEAKDWFESEAMRYLTSWIGE